MKKVLVIDDEQGIRDMLRFLLEGQGYDVVTAEDGVQGLEKVKESAFDVIFLDVHMPNMGGEETLSAIKKLRPAQPVVIFSSSSDPTHAFEINAEKSGVVCCMYKPVEIDEIFEAMKRAQSKH